MERLNTSQALAVLGWTHRNTLYGYVKSGAIPCHRGNGRNYYLRHELEAYIRGTNLTDRNAAFLEACRNSAHTDIDPTY